jgi:DNA (cytosine-5)-methyltransferase 1
VIALDLFAGTGWGVACQWLGIDEYGVELMDEAVATRDAAGMRTLYRDVWDGLAPVLPDDVRRVMQSYDVLIASPPCQTFSMAGKGAGRAALDEVLEAVRLGLYRDPVALRAFGADKGHDDRTALVLTPLAHVYRDRPTFVVFEQVPPVLPVWEACADVMRELGYSVWVGKLNAEQYGVPQTRTRAILMARRDGVDAAPPTPTHSRYYSTRPHQLDIGVEPWVSMAEALGWGLTERPFVTAGNAVGRAEGIGGSGGKAAIVRAKAEGKWLVGFPRRADSDDVVTIDGVEYRARDLREADGPAQAVTEKARSWERFEHLDPRVPVTTVAGDPRVSSRDHHEHGAQAGRATRLTVDEASRLQSYPPGFPWQGTKTKQFLQIGNAVPPLLARAVLEVFTERAG